MDLQATAQRSNRSFLILVCLFAFALRLAVVFAGSTYRITNDDTDHFGFGWEMGRVARSLVQGQGFSSPLPTPTGPTAIVGPIYPLLLALVFKTFGVYTTESSIAIRIAQSFFASLTCLFIYHCGRDTLGETTGKLAALAWAMFPLNIFFSAARIWETSLTAMLTVALFWYMLPLRTSLSSVRWSIAGALLGIAALINTSLVVLIAPFGLCALGMNRARLFRPVIVGILTCIAVLSPWLVRNRIQFGKFMLRSNFPLEFRVGNNEWSHGQKVESLHPSNTPSLNQHWRDVGESRFMAEDSELNSRFLATHFSQFAFDTTNRAINYWTGAWIKPTNDSPNQWTTIIGTSFLTILGFLGVWRMFKRNNSIAFMYAGCLFTYPLVYYVTTSQPRFYHAITPLLMIPGTFWVIGFKNRISRVKLVEAKRQTIGVD